ncbi:E3 ubiquitin-protein ligase Topors-like [Grus japonensis]|uniref:E3 ubiquitin-protein ligase Topors-like n=1 Tax=Grus japonensis TaxID=30415 RepID=A0ABC9X6Y6_GRUJA
MAAMGCRQSGQVAARAMAAQRWMQAWQKACQHGSTPAGSSRGPKQMGQVSPHRELLAAPGTAGSRLDASSAAAGTWCPVLCCWRDLMGAAGGSRWLLGRWQVTMAGVLLAGLDGSGAAHRTQRLVCRWQYTTLACMGAHCK